MINLPLFLLKNAVSFCSFGEVAERLNAPVLKTGMG